MPKPQPTAVKRQRSTPRVFIWGRALGRTAKIDVSSAIVGFQASRKLHQERGNFQLNIIPGLVGGQRQRVIETSDLYRKIGPNTLVSIGYDEPGGIMLGLVDRVSETVRPGTQPGQPVQHGLSIHGSDLGKVLVMDNIINGGMDRLSSAPFFAAIEAAFGPDHPLLKSIAGLYGPETIGDDNGKAVSFIRSPVEDVITWLLTNSAALALPMFKNEVGGNGQVASFITTNVTTLPENLIDSDRPSSFNGTMFNFLRRLLDMDLYELWIDSTPNGTEIPDVELFVRPKPFDEGALTFAPVSGTPDITWDNLQTRLDGRDNHEFFNHDLVTMDLGVSDADVYSYYNVTSQNELIGNTAAAQSGLAYPLVDTFVGKAFGVRSYTAELTLVGGDVAKRAEGDKAYTGEVVGQVRDARNRLFNWYRLNAYFESGRITVPGSDRIRPGDPVLLPERLPHYGVERGVRYYCTGVTWKWTYGQPFLCELELTRGHNNSTIDVFNADVLVDIQPANPQHFVEG